MKKITVKRTGRVFSIASSEYIVIFPDGTEETFWSPIWHDYTEKEENEKAFEYAFRLWEKRKVLNE